MADPVTEQMQNMNVQEYDGMEFDPLNQMDNMESVQNNGQQDLPGGNYGDKAEKIVLFDNQDQFDQMTFISQGQGHAQFEGEGHPVNYMNRNISEGEILGYQTEYGESFITGQNKYSGDDDNNLIDIHDTDVDNVDQGHLMGQYAGNLTHEEGENCFSPSYDEEHIENDYVETDEYSGENFQGQGEVEEAFDGGHVNEALEADSWHSDVDPERQRRSRSPDRSVSPEEECESYGERLSPGRRRRSLSPERSMSPPRSATSGGNDASAMSSPSCTESQSALTDLKLQTLSSETESLDSRSETQGTPKKSKMPKSKLKKPLELPPWNDNVVIPPPPRVKPTLIGKNSELPLSPTPKFRPKTALPRSSQKDASSDSGVEDDKMAKSPRKTSSDVKKFGVDTNNASYKPGGGNVQVFSQKVTTKNVAPRTDTSRPKSALTPRSTPKELSPVTPKPPTPNLKAVQSKINSLKNASHTPGGGNVKVLDAKVDFSNVQSKVDSKEKIHHKPKGGDKKILDQKVEIKAQSKVGSTANLKHKPGGGDKKIETQKLDFKDSAKSKVGSLDKVKHKPGGGDVKILDEKVDFSETAKPKVGSLEKVKHTPGGGDKKIETQKLNFKDSARPRTDTGASSGEKLRSRDSNSRSASVTSSQDGSLQG